MARIADDASPAFDLIIVGGGIAGSATAAVMARQGWKVLLLEKTEQFVDRVRGEWIAPWRGRDEAPGAL